jgi:SM-20-related protein
MHRIALVVLLLQRTYQNGQAWSIPVDNLHRRAFGCSSRLCREKATANRPGYHRTKAEPLAARYPTLLLNTSIKASSSATTEGKFPRLQEHHWQELDLNRYVVIPNFLPQSLQDALRSDVQTLRSKSKFKVAKIGQDATNTLNTDIRVAETCFLGPSKLGDVPNTARQELYTILDGVRRDLVQHMPSIKALDPGLTELLYAYYPQGGFYRRHRDAIPGSASTLRQISLLLYLNQNWQAETDGGCLRLHFDSGGDALPLNEEPNYMDVAPHGGTLVLLQSDAVPHEVLDTVGRDRLAVVGWYNRPVQSSDALELSNVSPIRFALAAFGLGLVTVGVLSLVS